MSALYPVDGHAFGTYASVPTDIYSKRPFVMAHSRRFRKGPDSELSVHLPLCPSVLVHP